MIESQSSIEIAKPAEAVFAFVDDTSHAPRWLQECVEVKQTSPGPKGVGSRLHYVHRQGGKRAEMDGSVTAYERDRRLGMSFGDPMLDVAIDFQFAPTAGGTRVTHSCVITPKTFLAKLMTPMIRGANHKQVAGNLARLKQALERGS
jgi:uncharacterized protein YndB with AHSA1/START domain